MTDKQRQCLECGTAYARAKADQRFCSTKCCKAFNNRRMRRGAFLYDLYMAARYDRKTSAGNITTMAQVSRIWTDEDKLTRAGRDTWTNSPDRDILTEISSISDRAIRDARTSEPAK